MSDPVICEVVVAAPADAVWHALREPAELRRWFGWDDDLCGHPHESAYAEKSRDRGQGRRRRA